MMYLIYNSNGSVKYENLVDFIVQGSNDVNKILISIDEHEPTAFSLSGHFVLPDGTITDISSDTTDSVEIDGTTYNGVVLALTSEVTALEGLVRVNIVAKENDTDKVLVTMQTFLTVNSGVSGSEIAIISQAEYNNLLSQIQRNVSNYETILTFSGSLPTFSNFQVGQIIYFTDSTNQKLYVKEQDAETWTPVFDFKDYYTKSQVYTKSETYNKTEIDSALSGKLDKKTTSGNYVYAHSGFDQDEIAYSVVPSANSIPLRTENGDLIVSSPSGDSSATPKGYVDAQVATKSAVSGTESDGKWQTLTIDGVTHQIGGSGSYAGGNGIDISGTNVISVDTEVVATQSDLQEVREVAEGKCKTLILSYQTNLPVSDVGATQFMKPDGTRFTDLADFNSYVSGLTYLNSSFNSQNNVLTLNTNSYFVDASYVVWKYTDIQANFNKGDLILVTETNVPDRWIAYLENPFVLYKLETTKVDLDNYYTKSQTNGLLANEFSSSSTYSVGAYVIYNNKLYRCVSDVSTAGAWNSGYWAEVKVANEMVDKSSAQTITGDKTISSGTKLYFGSSTNTYLTAGNALTIAANNDIICSPVGCVRADSNNSKDLGNSTNKWKNLYLAGNLYISSAFSDGTSSFLVSDAMGLFNKTESGTTVLKWSRLCEFSLSANTTFTLETAKTNCLNEYKAIITNSGASDITITLPSGTTIKAEDGITVSSNTFVISTTMSVELNLMNDLAFVVIRG